MDGMKMSTDKPVITFDEALGALTTKLEEQAMKLNKSKVSQESDAEAPNQPAAASEEKSNTKAPELKLKASERALDILGEIVVTGSNTKGINVDEYQIIAAMLREALDKPESVSFCINDSGDKELKIAYNEPKHIGELDRIEFPGLPWYDDLPDPNTKASSTEQLINELSSELDELTDGWCKNRFHTHELVYSSETKDTLEETHHIVSGDTKMILKVAASNGDISINIATNRGYSDSAVFALDNEIIDAIEHIRNALFLNS